MTARLASLVPIGTVLHPTYHGAPPTLEYRKAREGRYGWSRELPAGGYVEESTVDALLASGQYGVREQPGRMPTTVAALLAEADADRDRGNALIDSSLMKRQRALELMPVGTSLRWHNGAGGRLFRSASGWTHEDGAVADPEWVEDYWARRALVLVDPEIVAGGAS